MKRGWDKAVGFLTPSRSRSPAPSPHRQSQPPRTADDRHDDFDTPSGAQGALEGHSTDAVLTRGRTGHPADGHSEGNTRRRFVGGLRRALRSLVSRSPPPESMQLHSTSLAPSPHPPIRESPPDNIQDIDTTTPSGALVPSKGDGQEPLSTAEVVGNKVPAAAIPQAPQAQAQTPADPLSESDTQHHASPELTQLRLSSVAPSRHQAALQASRPEDIQRIDTTTPSGACAPSEIVGQDPSSTTEPEHGNKPAAEGSNEPSEVIDSEPPATAIPQAAQAPTPADPLPESDTNAHPETPMAEAAKPAAKSPFSTTKGKSTWYVAFQTTVDLVTQVSDVFPPLRTAAVAVKALMDVCDVSSSTIDFALIMTFGQAFSDNQEEFNKLAERVRFLDKILRGRPSLPTGIQDRRDGLAR